jgi:hypothetical protein
MKRLQLASSDFDSYLAWPCLRLVRSRRRATCLFEPRLAARAAGGGPSSAPDGERKGIPTRQPVASQSRGLSVPDYETGGARRCMAWRISDGSTVFPEPIGLGATFDPEAINRMAIAIGTEGRIKYVAGQCATGTAISSRVSTSGPRTSISFAIPVGDAAGNLRRRPIPDRSNGGCICNRMQGDDPKYYRAIRDAKHYAVHSGPESTRTKPM